MDIDNLDFENCDIENCDINNLENINYLENIDYLENINYLENAGKGNEFNNEINFVRNYITYFCIINFFCQCSIILYYYFDVEPYAKYLYNDITKFISRFQNRLSNSFLFSKLLNYNGDFDDFDISSDLSDLDSDVSLVHEVIKYEDKYLEDIKKMSLDYRFTWAELTLVDNKFTELFNTYKTNLDNEKANLNLLIVEKGMKYLEIDDDDDYENIDDGTNSDFLKEKEEKEEKEEKGEKGEKEEKKKKEVEAEINLLRSMIKEIEDKSDIDIIRVAKLEARNFIIKERLDGLKNNFIFEKTPLGNVIMYWNNSRESFEYYSDNTIPYRFLETVARKYVKTFNCRQIYVDMDFELNEFERKQKEKEEELRIKLLEDESKILLNPNSNSIEFKKKDVFAKFKNYNKESGTGKVNRGVAPPKNSIPNNNTKKTDEKCILKENSNRYTCEGKIANFSFLKKPDRKATDKKYAMSFSDYKKWTLEKVDKI